MNPGGPLEAIITALRHVGGYFVVRDTHGDNGQYVILRKEDHDKLTRQADEVQLDLLAVVPKVEAASADDMLEKINRDIAVWQLMHAEESAADAAVVDDLALPQPPRPMPPLPPPRPVKRVSFEPLKGDLSPDLQE